LVLSAGGLGQDVLLTTTTDAADASSVESGPAARAAESTESTAMAELRARVTETAVEQYGGVDEADLVETDGRFLYILSGAELVI
jgi:uncharacterized secreted protein with C-terminal beta-propeller domain